MKTYRTTAWIPIVLCTLALVGCGGGAAEEPVAENASASAPAAAAPASQAASGDGVTCRRIGVANQVATFLSCTDDEVRVLFCKQAPGGYSCECKRGPMMEEETFKAVTLEGKAYEQDMDDVQATHANATAAANEICGFEITHPCDGTS